MLFNQNQDPDSEQAIVYRVEVNAVTYPEYDHWGEFVKSHLANYATVNLYKYKLVRYTKCGFWFHDGMQERFVNLSWTKKYVHLTMQEAVEAAYYRVAAHKRRLERRLKATNIEYDAMKKLLGAKSYKVDALGHIQFYITEPINEPHPSTCECGACWQEMDGRG